jgi:hypothetical protein
MHTSGILFVLLAGFSFTGCAPVQKAPVRETPIPPSELLHLPVEAQVKCYNDPNLDRGGWYVWEFPGIEPTDPNSAYQGRRGELIGTLASCAWVTITDYSWSEIDQEFWVYVETKDVKGWITLDGVNQAPQPPPDA